MKAHLEKVKQQKSEEKLRTEFKRRETKSKMAGNINNQEKVIAVKKGGFFAAMKGPGAETELGESQSILHCMHASVDAVKELTLPSGEQRAILYIKKNGVTPTRFPRKAGEAERHPIK